jgi:tRNA(Ile)-lysidine synthase
MKNENLNRQFLNFVRQHRLFDHTNKLIVAISGGLDSVVLAHLCVTNGFNVLLAHVNFNLRGEESDADESLVRALATKWKVPVEVLNADTEGFVNSRNVGVQEAARIIRYEWFRSLSTTASEANPKILTAHHANDNVETILHLFFKGTGIEGLTGIPVQNKDIVRPLLFAFKADLHGYAVSNNLQWRDDSSNAQSKYTRNFLRNDIIPSIEKRFPALQQNVLHNAERLSEVNLIYRDALKRILNKLVVHKGEEWHIPIAGLLKQKAAATILYEILYPIGFSPAQCGEVFKMLQSDSGRFVETQTHKAILHRKWLLIVPVLTSVAQHIRIDEMVPEIVTEDARFTFRVLTSVPLNLKTTPDTAFIDWDKLSFPLLLRPLQKGDYFYPLGLRKKQKISDFLINNKVPLHQKEKLRLLTSGDRIVWVAGMRPDDRFKITPSTKTVLEIRLFTK